MTDRKPVSRRRQLVSQLLDTAQKLPGAELVQARAEQAERLILKELKSRMDRVASQDRALTLVETEADASHELRRQMGELIDRSADQSRDSAFAELCARLLADLLPDEARIVAALSDGEAHPMMHVGIGPKVGRPTEYLLKNLSTIGKPARVRLLDQVPLYLSRLMSLGLVETGREKRALDLQYQLLESDKATRLATARVDPDWTQSIRFIRRTVQLSRFGREFWSIVGPI